MNKFNVGDYVICNDIFFNNHLGKIIKIRGRRYYLETGKNYLETEKNYFFYETEMRLYIKDCPKYLKINKNEF